MHDDWYGHRDPFTGLPVGDRDEFIEWDFLLLDVLQVIEDSTDEYGLLVWERDDEAVDIDAVKKVHKFKQAVDRTTAGTANKPYKPVPGEYFVPRMHSRRADDSIQTRRDWIEGQIAEQARENQDSTEDDSW